LEQGRVLATGSYAQLVETNDTFRQLARQLHPGDT
jgi:hypothetical protein